MWILALNPFHGGSHRAFLEGWSRHSRHEFRMLTLPPRKWKWRMRHAPLTFAGQVAEMVEDSSDSFDLIFTTDMLNLPEFLGLCPPAVIKSPAAVYFHENQLTYPSSDDDPASRERDLHFAYTNFVTCLAASEVWFNSGFHRDEFLSALENWLRRMPDYRHAEGVGRIREKSHVLYPGIETLSHHSRRSDEPLRVAWVSRWEHDKQPEVFFEACAILDQRGVPFRLRILGESWARAPECFSDARTRFADRIDRFGYVESRDDYVRILAGSDVVVSTARHEFFGIAVVEAAAVGCVPVVPDSLSYPEVLNDAAVYHDGSPAGVADRLVELDQARNRSPAGFEARRNAAIAQASRYHWPLTARALDEAAERLTDE